MLPTNAQNGRQKPRILLLGGTVDARKLAEHLACVPGLTVISSLAGRVNEPRLPEGMVRVGGFGGVAGLASYLVDEGVAIVVDATHPYAKNMSRNAELACNQAAIPLVVFERPPWEPNEQDRWCRVDGVQAAAAVVDGKDNRVFLSIGRQELAAFSDCKHAWFLIRSIDEPVAKLPARSELILRRGPFSMDDELELFRKEAINLVVSKNSGGPSTFAKIEAARALQVPVVMIDRPKKHTIPTLSRLDEVLNTLSRMLEIPFTTMTETTEKRNL